MAALSPHEEVRHVGSRSDPLSRLRAPDEADHEGGLAQAAGRLDQQVGAATKGPASSNEVEDVPLLLVAADKAGPVVQQDIRCFSEVVETLRARTAVQAHIR